MGRLASVVVLSWMGADVSQLHLEQSIMSDYLNVGIVPDTSFLDLLTALAVMPLAAFTTLSVLGGGSNLPPSWMRIGDEVEIKTPEEEGDGGAIVASGRVIGAVAGAAIGVGVGMASVAASGMASKAQAAGNAAITAANAAPEALNSGSEVVSASGEVFSFVDDVETATNVVDDLDLSTDTQEVDSDSEFEGFGSMFD